MKQLVRVVSLVAVGLLILAQPGCKKKAVTGQAPQTVEQGVEQLRAALLKASPDVQGDLYNGVVFNLRYGKNVEALASLDKISSDPSLTPDQKKLVDQVIELLKQRVQGAQGEAK